MARLSKEEIHSYVGDVLPLYLIGDGIDKDSDVSFTVTGEAARIRTFTSDCEFSIKNGALVSLVREGVATVTAVYNGVEYLTRVTASPMKETEMSEDMLYLVGDMHHHTSMNHNHHEFGMHIKEDISDYVDFMRNEGLLDFTVISDHADVTNDLDFWRGFTLAEGEAPIIFAGAESEVTHKETDRLGILHRHSGELVTMMSAGYANVESFREFLEEMSYSAKPFAIFAHPHVVGFSTRGIWNFDFMKNNNSDMLSVMRGMEMGNGEDRKENLLHEYAYPAALDAGFKISTTCGSDAHGPHTGYNGMSGKTVLLAKGKTKEDIHEAFLKNRFYASESGNLKIWYTVNGIPAPATLPLETKYTFKVKLGYFRDDANSIPVRCEVKSDYGKTVKEIKIAGDELEFTVESETARYFYLKFIDGNARKTWSYPVWCGREFDTYCEPKIKALDHEGFTAVSDGDDVSKVINGDPYDFWLSKKANPSVVIDMKEERKIAALGYYPLIVVRGKDKGPDWVTSDDTRSLVSAFKVYTSLDGESWELVADRVAETLGCENIVEFAERLARYVRFDAISNIGVDSGIPRYKESLTAIANLTVFEKDAE